MWYVVWTKNGQEELVQELCGRLFSLEKELYQECFVPKAETERKVAGEIRKLVKPLFPGYLFFQSEHPMELKKALQKIPEFSKLLGADDTPQPLYPHEEDWLRRMMDKEMVIRMSRGYMVGDQLIVTEGPLKDFQGRLTHIDRHKRVARLELEFLGDRREVLVGLEVVRKIESELQ